MLLKTVNLIPIKEDNIMKLTKSKLKEMIKEVIAETDGYTSLIKTNKEVEHN